MHIYVGIPVIITDVEQKDRRKKVFCGHDDQVVYI
jgi:hypothetical protein